MPEKPSLRFFILVSESLTVGEMWILKKEDKTMKKETLEVTSQSLNEKVQENV